MSTKVYNQNTSENRHKVLQTAEFKDWFGDQPERFRAQISVRIAKIQDHGYFGDHKSVSDYEKGTLKNAIWELRWKDGKRVYYAYIPEKQILLILGGNKNGQDKDISKAKNIYLKTTKTTQKTR